MPSNNNKRVAAPTALLRGLNETGIEFILVGGLAEVAQGAPVTTFDVEIVHRQSDKNVKNLLRFLKSVDAYQRRSDNKVIEPNEKHLKGKGHVLLTTRFGPLDILAAIEQGRGFDALIEDTIELEFQGHTIRVLSLETIVALKRGSRDPKDKYRLPILEETLRQIRAEEQGDE
jgi:predicted nucleotidyltransferase